MATEDPMTASVPGRYASALFDLANEEKKLAEVERDMATVASLLVSRREARRPVA